MYCLDLSSLFDFLFVVPRVHVARCEPCCIGNLRCVALCGAVWIRSEECRVGVECVLCGLVSMYELLLVVTRVHVGRWGTCLNGNFRCLGIGGRCVIQTEEVFCW